MLISTILLCDIILLLFLLLFLYMFNIFYMYMDRVSAIKIYYYYYYYYNIQCSKTVNRELSQMLCILLTISNYFFYIIRFPLVISLICLRNKQIYRSICLLMWRTGVLQFELFS